MDWVGKVNVDEFVKSQLIIPRYDLTSDDRSVIEEWGISEYIFRKVTHSKYRRTKVDQETEKDIRKKTAQALDNEKPISFSIPFGAYKNWELWSYPEPEWAEVFNINYMLNYVMPIVSVYKPGVILYYSYGDKVMDIVSNMPIKDTERYINTFRELVTFFQKRVPDNLAIRCMRINTFYESPEEHKRELREHYEDNRLNWETKFSEEQRKEKVDSAKRNLMLKGIEDLTQLTPDELEEKFVDAAMWCNAHDSLKKRRGFNKYGDNIQLVYVRGPIRALHIGSCETSAFHFWVGTGVIEIRRNRILRRIFSQAKLESLLASGDARFVDVNSPFGHISDNFNRICLWTRHE